MAWLAFASAAHAGDQEEVANAKGHVDAFRYAEAAGRLSKMLDASGAPCPKSGELTRDGCRLTAPSLIEEARGLYAIALTETSKREEAKTQFKEMLRANPTFTPRAAEYPFEVIKLFAEAKEEIAAELTAAAIAAQAKLQAQRDAEKKYDEWVDEMERLAKRETVLAERSRWIAAIPFGVGQFQNDSVGLGILFLSLESAFLTGTIVTGALHADYALCGADPETCNFESADGEASEPVVSLTEAQRAQLHDQMAAVRIANYVSLGLLGATVIAGIIEAEASFKQPMPRTRQRKVTPRPLKPKPVVSMGGVPNAPDATGLGLIIRF